MEVSELLADSSNEAQSSVDGPDHAVINSDHRILSQGHAKSDSANPDAGVEREVVPDCSKVPSSSQTHVETVPITGDPDIFLYMALSVAVVMITSAFYKQVMKK